MITIELVKVTRNGVTMLVGRRYQDRWNLLALGVKVGIRYDRNQTSVKAMRRRLAGHFTVSVVRNAQPELATYWESRMMGPAYATTPEIRDAA